MSSRVVQVVVEVQRRCPEVFPPHPGHAFQCLAWQYIPMGPCMDIRHQPITLLDSCLLMWKNASNRKALHKLNSNLCGGCVPASCSHICLLRHQNKIETFTEMLSGMSPQTSKGWTSCSKVHHVINRVCVECALSRVRIPARDAQETVLNLAPPQLLRCPRRVKESDLSPSPPAPPRHTPQ